MESLTSSQGVPPPAATGQSAAAPAPRAFDAPRTQAMPVAIVLVCALLALPFVLSDYQLFQATMVLIYAITLFGLNLLTGYSGQISLGHGAFYALGAYAAAILIGKTGVPYWVAVPAAGMICLAVGFLFGLPALRLEGLYLALATFALAVSMPQLLKYKALEPWTGGVQGLSLDKPSAPFGLNIGDDLWFYLFCLACAVVMFILGMNLLAGRIGRALVAIRDQPIAASAMGVNLPFYKAMTFGISSAFAGVGGALGAIASQFIAPDTFSVYMSIGFLVGIVVGGLASVPGALIGAIFIQFIPNVSEQISKSAPWMVYGVVLILTAYVFPDGVAGLLREMYGRLQVRFGGSRKNYLR